VLPIIAFLIFFVPMLVVCLMSFEFGEKGLSVMDRWRGVRRPSTRDHNGIY
jgi:hypothetical protein